MFFLGQHESADAGDGDAEDELLAEWSVALNARHGGISETSKPVTSKSSGSSKKNGSQEGSMSSGKKGCATGPVPQKSQEPNASTDSDCPNRAYFDDKSKRVFCEFKSGKCMALGKLDVFQTQLVFFSDSIMFV